MRTASGKGVKSDDSYKRDPRERNTGQSIIRINKTSLNQVLHNTGR